MKSKVRKVKGWTLHFGWLWVKRYPDGAVHLRLTEGTHPEEGIVRADQILTGTEWCDFVASVGAADKTENDKLKLMEQVHGIACIPEGAMLVKGRRA